MTFGEALDEMTRGHTVYLGQPADSPLYRMPTGMAGMYRSSPEGWVHAGLIPVEATLSVDWRILE